MYYKSAWISLHNSCTHCSYLIFHQCTLSVANISKINTHCRIMQKDFSEFCFLPLPHLVNFWKLIAVYHKVSISQLIWTLMAFTHCNITKAEPLPWKIFADSFIYSPVTYYFTLSFYFILILTLSGCKVRQMQKYRITGKFLARNKGRTYHSLMATVIPIAIPYHL